MYYCTSIRNITTFRFMRMVFTTKTCHDCLPYQRISIIIIRSTLHNKATVFVIFILIVSVQGVEHRMTEWIIYSSNYPTNDYFVFC